MLVCPYFNIHINYNYYTYIYIYIFHQWIKHHHQMVGSIRSPWVPYHLKKKCDIAMEHGHRKFIDLPFLKILNTAIFSTVNCENTKGYYQDDNHPWEWQWVGINHRWLGYGIPGCHTPGAASKWFISPWAVAHVKPIYIYTHAHIYIYIYLKWIALGWFPTYKLRPPSWSQLCLLVGRNPINSFVVSP